MKVLLISVNKEKSLRPVLPIGMVTIATVLEKTGHIVKCLDLCFEEDDRSAIEDACSDYEPECIGISIRNIDSQSFIETVYYPPILLKVVMIVRELFDNCKIIFGGPGYSLVPEELLRYCKADYGIIGLGEKSTPMLLERIEKGLSVDDVPGVLYIKDDGSCYAKDQDYSINLNNYPFPERKFYDKRYFGFEYNDISLKQTYNAFESIQTKRGCAVQCIYCNNKKIDGPNIMLREPQNVVDEMLIIQNLGLSKGFEIVDGLFNLPYNHAMNVLKLMNEQGVNMPWACMLNPGSVTEELISLMKSTGCERVEFGTDSGSNKILKTLSKNFDREDIMKAYYLVKKYGLHQTHCVFIGSPGETIETIHDTFTLLEEMAPHKDESKVSIFITFGYRIYDQTKLYEIALEQGVLSKDANLAIPHFYVEPSILHNSEVLKYIEDTLAKHPNWYMWWGIGNISLSDRIEETQKEHKKIANLYNMVLEEYDG